MAGPVAERPERARATAGCPSRTKSLSNCNSPRQRGVVGLFRFGVMAFDGFINAETGEIFDVPPPGTSEDFWKRAWQVKPRFIPVPRFAELVVQARRSRAAAHPEFKHVLVWRTEGRCAAPGNVRLRMRKSSGVDDILTVSLCGGPNAELEVIIPCQKCPACVKRRQNQWVDRAECEISSGAYSMLVTFTLNGKSLRLLREEARASLSEQDREASVRSPVFRAAERRAMLALWRGFRARVQRYAGTGLVYQACVEWGERRGRLHLHANITVEVKEGNVLLPQRFLQEEWARFSAKRKHRRQTINGIRRLADVAEAKASGHYASLGRVHFRSQVPGGKITGAVKRVAFYVSKYVGKSGVRVLASNYYGRPAERPALLVARREKRAEARASQALFKAMRVASSSDAAFRAHCGQFFELSASGFVPWATIDAESVIAAERVAFAREGLRAGPKVRLARKKELVKRWASMRSEAKAKDQLALKKLTDPCDPERLERAWIKSHRLEARILMVEERRKAGIETDGFEEGQANDPYTDQMSEAEWREAWADHAQWLHDTGRVQLTNEEFEDMGLDVSPPF